MEGRGPPTGLRPRAQPHAGVGARISPRRRKGAGGARARAGWYLIDFALRDLLRRKSQRALMELKGSVTWRGSLDRMRGADKK